MKSPTLSRRLFLSGAGACLALPLFSSLRPRKLFAAADPRPKRLIVVYTPNGMNMADWTPAQGGADYTLSPILQPIAPIRSKVLVLSGIDNPAAAKDGFGAHAPATGAFLTCHNVNKSQNIQNGISMDQVAANHIGDSTRFRSLQLGTHGGSNAGGCDGGYSCAYTRNISWANKTTPMPKLIRPRAVFDLMFAGADPNATVAEIERRRLYKKSVLDSMLSDAASLESKLSTADANKLDQYMSGVRELELRIDADADLVCTAGDRPPNDPNFPTTVKLMMDLMALAVQCDLTRVATFMMGNSISGQSFPFAGVNGAHHAISHHQRNPNNLAMLTKIDRWEVEQFSYLIQKLDQMDDGDGTTVLDNSLVFFGNEVSDGNSHGITDLPIMLAGSAGGAIRSGRHVRYANALLGDLYISMLRHLGVDITSFGDHGTKAIGRLA